MTDVAVDNGLYLENNPLNMIMNTISLSLFQVQSPVSSIYAGDALLKAPPTFTKVITLICTQNPKHTPCYLHADTYTQSSKMTK